MKIVITDCDHGFFDPEEQAISASPHELVIADCRTAADVIAVASDADALICQYVPITRSLLESLPNCKIVGRYGMGVDNIDIAAATDLGVKVLNAPFFCIQEVATHTLALILDVSRKITLLNQRLKSDPEGFMAGWGGRMSQLEGIERLSDGRILGIVGFGKIGSLVTRGAQALGFEVIAHDLMVPQEIMALDRVRKCTKEELLKSADIVSLHMPLSEETNKFIGSAELALMKESAYLINTSRGPLVDEESLIQALSGGQIAGAALDVLETEPFRVDHPFMNMENVILTPHIAFYSRTSINELKRQIAQHVANALSGSSDYFTVNPEVKLSKET